MARPRKIMKRVKLSIEIDMSQADHQRLKADLMEVIKSYMLFETGRLVYLATDSENLE